MVGAKSSKSVIALASLSFFFSTTSACPASAEQLRPYAPGTSQPRSGALRPPTPVVDQDADWRFLRDPNIKRAAIDELRYIPFGDGEEIFLSIGLEARVQLEFFDEEDWGRNAGADLSLHTRFDPSMSLQVGDRLKLHAGLKHGAVIGRDFFTPAAEVDDIDLHKAFVEIAFGDWFGLDTSDVFLRVGRQEYHFGSGRLVSLRNGPNVRSDFDGITLRMRVAGRITDVFAAYATKNKKGSFDNGTNKDESLIGFYSAGALNEFLGLDIYAFRQYRREVQSIEGVGDDYRNTIGFRAFSPEAQHAWVWDIDAYYQFGDFHLTNETLEIGAWSVAGHVGRKFDGIRWRPQTGVRFGYTSGDAEPDDGKLGVLKPPYPPGRYFGFASSIGPGNLVGGSIYIAVTPTEKFMLEAQALAFWRLSNEDGLYNPPGLLIVGNAGEDHYVGSEFALSVQYDLGDGVSLGIAGGRFFTGRYFVENPPGQDVTYIETALSWKF